MLWPAAKMGDLVIGVDLHTVIIPPAPAPVPMTPHAYFGSVFLWMTPTFPTVNVLINGRPAAAAGAMGFGAHLPVYVPVPPTMLNLGYWKRYLQNVPMSLMLVALTLMANLAIAGISALLMPPDSDASTFVKDVTGIDTTNGAKAWTSVTKNLAAYTQWATWIKLLMPPVPYPAGQGSTAIGSPNVLVNGGPLAFCAPLMGTSCSDLPIVPNACVLGFSNVMVGMTPAAMARALAVSMSKAAVNAGVKQGVKKVGAARAARRKAREEAAKAEQGRESSGC